MSVAEDSSRASRYPDQQLRPLARWLVRVQAYQAATVAPVKCGSSTTTLVVIRGNSGSGKSTVAEQIRVQGSRVAIVGQDHLRRVILKEKDRPGAANIGLIDLVTRYALDAGYTTVLEGILYVAHYGGMLTQLRADHVGTSLYYYMDVPYEETLRRHATKPNAHEYGAAEMSSWWRERDLMPGGLDQVLTADLSADGTASRILRDARRACAGL
jgi:predicted kinase